MAKRIKIVTPIDDAFTNALPYTVASGAAATIDRGTPTKVATNDVAVMVDGDGTTSQRFTGIAKTKSTDTASAAGEVFCWLPLPGIVYAASPKVANDANTAAKIKAKQHNRVVFDLASGDWTIDFAASDSATNGLVIIGGQPEQDLVYFVVSVTATVLE